jgi:hypothetical protein
MGMTKYITGSETRNRRHEQELENLWCVQKSRVKYSSRDDKSIPKSEVRAIERKPSDIIKQYRVIALLNTEV